MGADRRKGNHKGCPYDGFAGAYFRSNRSCRQSPTPISYENGGIVFRVTPLVAGNERWIPAFAGMTVWVLRWLFSEESFMQAKPAHRGMKIGLSRERATTRIAPT